MLGSASNVWYAHFERGCKRTVSDWHAAFEGRSKPTNTFKLVVQRGRKADFLNFCSYVCINEKVRALLIEHKFTGWSEFPAEVIGRKGERIDGYSGLSVAVWEKFSWSESQRVSIEIAPDLFRPPRPAGNGAIIVSSRVVSLFAESKVTGVVWKRV
jgi:hypothetical protein